MQRRNPSKTGGEANMRSLPGPLAAVCFAYRCLNLDGDGDDPIHRQTLKRARDGHFKSREKADEIREALKARTFPTLFGKSAPPDPPATNAREIAAFALLKEYETWSPRVRLGEASPIDALWVFCREIALPTLRRILVGYENRGLGTEFRGESCWYNPQTVEGELKRPVAVILDRWLRLTGFRTSYGVSKPKGSSRSEAEDALWETQRKQVKRWLNGETVPALDKLLLLVGKFENRIEWIDTPDSWCARFSMACSAERACEKVDSVFAAKAPSAAWLLAEDYRALCRETAWRDDAGLLTDLSTLIPVRLWLKELKSTGEFAQLQAEMPETLAPPSAPGISAETRRINHENRRAKNFSNRLAAHLLKAAGLPTAALGGKERSERQAKLKAFLLEFAENKLNRLIAEEHTKAGGRAAPRRKQQVKRTTRSD